MAAAPDEETVSVRREGAVALVELRRERKLNALSTAMEERLDATVASAEVRESACVVFTGGARAFSAGADVTEFRDADAASVAAYYAGTGGVYERIARLPQPTVAAISGYCLGGGLELALAADIRVADLSAAFGLPEVGLGIIPSSGGVLRLTRAVGPARAKELVLRGRRFDATEAHAIGIVTEVADDALARALEIAAELAALPPLAVRTAKATIDLAAESSREAAILMEQLAYGMLAQTPDAHAAATAFTDNH
jgi:enoyl-CoA hydratase/carnithine racemase